MQCGDSIITTITLLLSDVVEMMIVIKIKIVSRASRHWLGQYAGINKGG